MKEEKRPFTDEEVRTKFLETLRHLFRSKVTMNNFACSLPSVKRLLSLLYLKHTVSGALVNSYWDYFQDRVMKATHKFSQFTYWNLETPPSNNDAIIKAMQWINIAAAVSNGNYIIYSCTHMKTTLIV